MKKILSVILAAAMVLSLVGCGSDEKLATPDNLNISSAGLISWSAVEHADSYVVTVDETQNTVTETQYLVQPLDHSFTFSVVAKGKGYLDSDPVTSAYTAPEASVSIEGKSSVPGGQTVKYTATVTGAANASVTWSVKDGGDFATIDASGNLKTNEVSEDKVVVVCATSNANTSVSAEKTVTILAKTELTQKMLDEIASHDTVQYISTIDVNIYTIGSRPTFVGSDHLDTETAMDGTNWYASYRTNDAAGIERDLFYKNVDGDAKMVSVSLMNEESYIPMLDENGEAVSWEEAGLYNAFAGTPSQKQPLKVEDFTFDPDEFRWEYTGSDQTLAARMVASANPYDFTPVSFALIIEEGEIMGFVSESADDFQLSPGNRSEMTLTAIVDFVDIEVPTIKKFKHETIHEPLAAALEKMHALDSYKMEFRHIQMDLTGSGYTQTGYFETVTPDLVLFQDFDWDYVGTTEDYTVERTFTDSVYGYKKTDDTHYNLFYNYDSDGDERADGYIATRAYEGDVSAARPGLNFAPEIFTYFAKGSATDDYGMYYEVADGMELVATEFYHYVPVLDQLYGMYVAVGSTGTQEIRPSVTVDKDGYISELSFYYNAYYMSGVIEIYFSEFDTATIEDPDQYVFETRTIPQSWDEIMFNDYDTEDAGVTFTQAAKELLGTETPVPFFGSVLGDCYAFSVRNIYRAADNQVKTAVQIMLDVPIDLDYTIDSSVKKLTDWFKTQGCTSVDYTETGTGYAYEYKDDTFGYAVASNETYLYVYIWAL